MDDDPVAIPPWLPELKQQIQIELARLENGEDRQKPALESEHAELRAKCDGWLTSLANRQLSPNVRSAVEAEFDAATRRMQEIEQLLVEKTCRSQKAEQIVGDKAIIDRLKRLGDVLANYSPIVGNLELSLHVDCIVCSADGHVTMRTCKLGAVPDLVDLLATDDAAPTTDTAQSLPSQLSRKRSGPRRRGRLRVSGTEDRQEETDMRALADFAADPHRFAGLDEKWFWIDTFSIPEKSSWVRENAQRVLQRFSDIKSATGKAPSLNLLAREFGKSRPTIKAALDIANGTASYEPKRRGRRGKYSAPVSEATKEEISRLFHEDQREIGEIAETTGIHRNTVARLLNEWYASRGEKRPDARSRLKRGDN